MLFNSYVFIFIFLPLTLLGFFALGRRGHRELAIAWLVLASLFFYGWWNPVYLLLLLASIVVNYSLGRSLSHRSSKPLLGLGIAFNLGLLGYFKYANFFVENINLLLNSNIYLDRIVLPLAISFFTFQQISYLVDAFKGYTKEYSFLHYCLFVSFFPQLIAGPIVHHKEMLPQFGAESVYRFNPKTFAVGLTAFLIGLFKKVVLADEVAKFSTPVFAAAAKGVDLSFAEAWTAGLAYSFQIYFDFSGYSDMAIGLALLFGIRLPLNFYSPYKSTSIIEVWRRWHITLGRFLMQYIYIPLGGGRCSTVRKYFNLSVTFILAGIWHGAGWNYILWGVVQSVYLVSNNLWRDLKKVLGISGESWWRIILAGSFTYLLWVVSLIVFRSESLSGMQVMLSSAFGLNGFDLSASLIKLERAWYIFIPLALIVWGLPNTQQLLSEHEPTIDTYRGQQAPPRLLQWKPSAAWACYVGVVGLLAVLYCTQPSEFLYFQF